MKGYTVQTVNNFSFIIHGWLGTERVYVCGKFANGETGAYGVDKFIDIDKSKVDEVDNVNFPPFKQ